MGTRARWTGRDRVRAAGAGSGCLPGEVSLVLITLRRRAGCGGRLPYRCHHHVNDLRSGGKVGPSHVT